MTKKEILEFHLRRKYSPLSISYRGEDVVIILKSGEEISRPMDYYKKLFRIEVI